MHCVQFENNQKKSNQEFQFENEQKPQSSASNTDNTQPESIPSSYEIKNISMKSDILTTKEIKQKHIIINDVSEKSDQGKENAPSEDKNASSEIKSPKNDVPCDNQLPSSELSEKENSNLKCDFTEEEIKIKYKKIDNSKIAIQYLDLDTNVPYYYSLKVVPTEGNHTINKILVQFWPKQRVTFKIDNPDSYDIGTYNKTVQFQYLDVDDKVYTFNKKLNIILFVE